jgi:phage-related protein
MPVALKSLSRKPKPPKPPEADPRFVKVMGDLRQKSLKVRQHPAPSKKASEAQAAAKGPANEKRAGAQEKQTDKIKDAKTKKPDENSFLALLRAEIQKAMPKTLADTETFMKGGDAPALTSSLKGNVSKQKQDATGDTAKTTKQAPDESSVKAKPVTPIPGEPQPPAPDVPAGDAMPQPKPDAEVSLQDSKQDTDAAMKDAEVTDDQCKKANDPRFSSVLTAKGDVAKQADAAPAKYRAGEKAALNASVAQSKAAAKVGAALMLQGKAKSKAGVSSKQEDAKKKDEQERQQVTDRIEAIFNKTKQQVEAKLTALDEEVNSIFDTGTEAALSAMKAYVEKRIDDYKDERYSGLVGKGRWLKDKFMGLPDEANVFYVQGRNLFTQLMDTLVVRVANLVETRLREAKSLVAAGQAEIKSYVASLSPKLKGVGLEAQKKVSDQFAELERTIDDKKNQLAQALAQKYKEAFDKADKALKEIQDANKGLVSAFLDKLGEIIKIIMEFKDKLMGVLRKGWDVIKGILADPIGFLGNLIAAIKQGVGQFVSNIWTHLKAGFMKWLFGALADAGIEIPPGLPSLPSILKLVLSVLGLTYERMRAKAVKLLGPTAVTIIEKAIEYVRALITGGPAALWEKVKEDLSSLKEMVIGAIQDWIITTIIKQATVKLLSMFNPAGAFVQACIMIYNTVMFLIERAAQIMAFVEAVINSVSAIASGAIGGAAAWIERSLANAIPVVIGFLAALIGLGGISKKIKETIEKIQGVVDRAIDKAIGKVIEVVKKLFGKLTGKGKKDGKEESHEERWKKGKAAVQAYLKSQEQKEEVFVEDYEAGLAGIKEQYGFTALKIDPDGGTVDAAMSPGEKIKNDWPLVARKNLTAPEGLQIQKGVSNRGNKRVFAVTASGVKKFVYNARTKKWQHVKDDERIRKAEEGLRALLKSERSQYISLVEAGKAASAQGFDAGGMGRKRGEDERVAIGEVKGGFRKGQQYFAAEKFTAITSSLATNLDESRRVAEAQGKKVVERFDAAVASGNITVVIQLVGKAVVAGTVWPKLENIIRSKVRAYIKANYEDVELDEVMKNVRIQWR